MKYYDHYRNSNCCGGSLLLMMADKQLHLHTKNSDLTTYFNMNITYLQLVANVIEKKT